MLSEAGSRLPWKSFQASTCTSLVRAGLPVSKLTDTVSVRVRALEIVGAALPAGPVAASGANRTAPRLTVTRPPCATRDLGRKTEPKLERSNLTRPSRASCQHITSRTCGATVDIVPKKHHFARRFW